MQPLTFACPKCGRRMGVGLDMSGRQVRCPHCRQVVVAPSAAATKPTGSRTDLPAVPPLPPDAEPDSKDVEVALPKFGRPPREGAESIFGESDHDDDSLFASPDARKPLLPDLPSSLELGAEPAMPGMIDFNSAEEAARQSMPPTDALESGEVVRPILGPPTPFLKKDISVPDFELFPKSEKTPASPMPRPVLPPPPPPPAAPFAFPKPAPASPAKPEETVNPWAKLPAAVVPPPASGRKLVPAAAPPRRSKLVWALLAYAVVVTLLAAWGWLQSRPHPLSTIPDFFGQYRQTERKKVSALPVDANQAIPANLRVKLGQKLALGDLEFEPLAVEERKTKWEGDRPRDIECLVLTARVRNVSKTASFHPMDPAYNRYATANSPPLSGVVVGRERFLGGPIPWPFQGGREYVIGQEKDDEPLEPGQDRTTVIPAIDGEKGKKLMTLVRAAKGTLLWQVHVRRGFVSFQGEDVSVGALIGVEFDASQVKR